MAEEDEIVRSWPPLPALTSTYSNITASGNSRVQNGHVFHFHQSCSVQHDGGDVAGSVQQASLKRKRSLADIEANPRTPGAQRTLNNVLKKLGKLALSIRHQKEGEGAEKIARCVAAVFDNLVAHRDGETWDKNTERQLGKLGATIKWADLIDINSVLHRKAPVGDAKARSRQVSVHIGGWNISLTTTTTDMKPKGGHRSLEIFSTLRIEPVRGSSGLPLAVFFREHAEGHARSTIPPKVLAYNKVNDSAEVFGVILRDDVDALRRLLDYGQASLRDCDEEGRSLLHYACKQHSHMCCSFLINLGADVDRSALPFVSFGYENRDNLLPLHVLVGHWVAFSDRTSSCLKALLQAGADPTLTKSTSEKSPISQFMPYSSEHAYGYVRCILEEGSAYMDFSNNDNKLVRSYWLEACSMLPFFRRPEILYQYIRAGADIAEVDQDGFNCLFLFMFHADGPRNSDDIKALSVLLTIFDDIYAHDARGNDLFAYVNEIKEWPRNGLRRAVQHSSYKQDLWYCALARNGLDMRYGVQPFDRLARYTKDYTPRHYQALCHLDDWSEDTDLEEVLSRYPLTEEEEAIQLRFGKGWWLARCGPSRGV